MHRFFQLVKELYPVALSSVVFFFLNGNKVFFFSSFYSICDGIVRMHCKNAFFSLGQPPYVKWSWIFSGTNAVSLSAGCSPEFDYETTPGLWNKGILHGVYI